jgi:hypothetical protein
MAIDELNWKMGDVSKLVNLVLFQEGVSDISSHRIRCAVSRLALTVGEHFLFWGDMFDEQKWRGCSKFSDSGEVTYPHVCGTICDSSHQSLINGDKRSISQETCQLNQFCLVSLLVKNPVSYFPSSLQYTS